MYQSLRWPAGLRDEARRLRTALDFQYLQSAADALVDGMRRNIELDRYFLGRQMLVDQAQTVELARTEPCDPGSKLGLEIAVISHDKGGFRQPEFLSTQAPRTRPVARVPGSIYVIPPH